MELHTGTSGFSYDEWKGSFYPEELAKDAMLSFYAERLGAVEMNNTFYRLPKPSVLESWAEQVPAGFRFSIKASRKITHFARLKPEAADATRFLVESVASLGGRLGALLFQLPPNMKADVERLGSFLDLLPEGLPVAWEFRHPSWDDEEVRALLSARKMAVVASDTEDEEEDAPVHGTASWGYLRLRRPDYGEEDLRRWAEVVRAQEWGRAFVFFKHEDEGAGPRLAERFAELFEEG